MESQSRNAWKVGGTPANYTEDDPIDLEGLRPLLERMQTAWFEGSYDEYNQRIVLTERAIKAVTNAIRAAMLSPQLKLHWNAVIYQGLTADKISPFETDPQVYVDAINATKAEWDSQIDREHEHPLKRQKAVTGFKNVFSQNMAEAAGRIQEITRIALTDVWLYQGRGYYWRDRLYGLGNKSQTSSATRGAGLKILSFAWLLLMPLSSELATLDLWMPMDAIVPQTLEPDLYRPLQQMDLYKQSPPPTERKNDARPVIDTKQTVPLCPNCGSAFVWRDQRPEDEQRKGYTCQTCTFHFTWAYNPINIDDPASYLTMETELNRLRGEKGYGDINLGAYQWAEWDYARTGPSYRGRQDKLLERNNVQGYHQDHSPLRVEDPVPADQIDWGTLGTDVEAWRPEEPYRKDLQNWQQDPSFPIIGPEQRRFMPEAPPLTPAQRRRRRKLQESWTQEVS